MEPVTHKGRVIPDEEIEAMADEAEAGYDLSTLKRLPGLPWLGAARADVTPDTERPCVRVAFVATAP